jgi:polar amino acid transport system substrate-binding protein
MKTKNIIVVLLAALLLMQGVYAGGKKETAAPDSMTIKDGVLMIGMEIGYPPFEYFDADGKTPIGFDVQLGNAIAKKLGLKVEIVDTAWDGIFAGVNTGKYDCIISAVTITEERKAVHNFSTPYIGNAQAMVLLKGSTVTAKNPEELGGLGVAYQAETTSDIYMTKLADEKGLKFTAYEYDKVMNCFDDLKNGRCDAVVCDSLVAIDYVNAEDSPFQMVWQGTADEKFGICMKKGNDKLTAAIDKALEELFADGTVLAISQDVFKMDMVSSVR